jgi:hypothetical protein
MLSNPFLWISENAWLPLARGQALFAPLLAQRSVLRDMGSGFRDRREMHWVDLLPWALVLGTVIAVLMLISRFMNRRDSRRLYSSPRRLFGTLCRAHALDRASCRLLQQLARANAIAQPAQLFLDPDYFLPTRLTPELLRHQAAVAALREKLFAIDGELRKEEEGPPPMALDVLAPASSLAAQPEPVATFTPAAPTLVDGRLGGESIGDAELDEEPEPGPSMAERNAVKALEALMRQINGSASGQSAKGAAPSATAGTAR